MLKNIFRGGESQGDYLAPQVSLFEFSVEQGFANSIGDTWEKEEDDF